MKLCVEPFVKSFYLPAQFFPITRDAVSNRAGDHLLQPLYVSVYYYFFVFLQWKTWITTPCLEARQLNKCVVACWLQRCAQPRQLIINLGAEMPCTLEWFHISTLSVLYVMSSQIRESFLSPFLYLGTFQSQLSSFSLPAWPASLLFDQLSFLSPPNPGCPSPWLSSHWPRFTSSDCP